MPWDDDDNFETETWHYIKAANDSGRRSGGVRLLVGHSAETDEGPNTAVGIGNWFARPSTRGSTHAGVDGSPEGDGSPHTCQYVYDSLVAWGAAGMNHDGLHCEVAGRARQTREDWLDDYSRLAIAREADVFAQWALKYSVPVRRLTNGELKAGWSGIVGHVQGSEVYRKSDHWDPGAGFPWDRLIKQTDERHRHWLSTHPGFQPQDDRPDFNVVVLADNDIDEGIARVLGKFHELKFLRWPVTSVSFGAAVMVGSVAENWSKIKKASMEGITMTIRGANRSQTAAAAAQTIREGRRSMKLPY